MGCCQSGNKGDGEESSEGRTNSHEEPLLRSDSVASSVYWNTECHGPSGEDYPTWAKDEVIHRCYKCDLKFSSLVERKHHCRRCRNIFCNNCTAQRSEIRAFSIHEPVRVCDQCHDELVEENNFICKQQPALVEGDCFVRYKMMGMTSYIVRLWMTDDAQTLIYQPGTTKSEILGKSVHIALQDVSRVAVVNLTTFDLCTPAKTYNFEADCAATMKFWVDALKVAAYRSKLESLRIRVDNQRKVKADMMRIAAHEQKRADAIQASRDRRMNQRGTVKQKYNL